MVRHIRWQVGLIIIGVLLLGGLMIYLATTFTIQREPAPGGTYVEGLLGTPQFVNPLLCQYNEVDRDLCSLIFSGLIRYDERGLPQPDLAERWDVSADGLVYTFHLRPNARWHDDQPVTAADVVFTLQLLARPQLSRLARSRRAVANRSSRRSQQPDRADDAARTPDAVFAILRDRDFALSRLVDGISGRTGRCAVQSQTDRQWAIQSRVLWQRRPRPAAACAVGRLSRLLWPPALHCQDRLQILCRFSFNVGSLSCRRNSGAGSSSDRQPVRRSGHA